MRGQKSMLNYPDEHQLEVPQTIEQNTRTIAWATVLIRKSIAETTYRKVDDIPIGASIYCARVCCSDGGDYQQHDQVTIIRHARLIADTCGTAQKKLAEALNCSIEEIPIKHVINLSLEAVWDYEQRKANRFYAEHKQDLVEGLSDVLW